MTDWRATPEGRDDYRRGVYTRGAEACRAALRDAGHPEHGPGWRGERRDSGATEQPEETR